MTIIPDLSAYPKSVLDLEMIAGVPQPIAQKHFDSVIEHIRYVQEAGVKLHVPSRLLLVHDLSKFSAEEFSNYAKHFHGGGDKEGFLRGWLHHLHANPHHWQYYIIPNAIAEYNGQRSNQVLEMPQSYVLEMIADWMGASMTYTGTWEIGQWLVEEMPKISLHEKSTEFCRVVLREQGYGKICDTRLFRHEIDKLGKERSA